MKLFKKILSLVSSLAVGATLFCGTNIGFSASAVQGVLYYEIANGKAYVYDCTDDAMTVDIPATYNGYPVVGIYSNVFNDSNSLTTITVNSSNQYFSSINGVLFNKNATTIVRYPRAKTGSSYTIPSTVQITAEDSFWGCANLTSVTIPSNVINIGVASFVQTGLTSVTIPSSVTSIGGGAFSGCIALTAITVNSSNQYYSSLDGVLFDKNMTKLLRYPIAKTGTSYSIPSTVTDITGAFYFCTGLLSVTIPISVITVGVGAFLGCTGLTSITIPNGVTSVGHQAFMNCTGLTSITIPNSVTSIEYGAFDNCTSLISITIPNSVTTIEDDVFYGCSSSLHINSRAGTAANTYATNNNINFVAVIYGNVYDGDSVIDIKDLSKLSKYIAQTDTLTAQQMLNADVYYDGVVDVKDLSIMQRYIAGYNVNLGPSL